MTLFPPWISKYRNFGLGVLVIGGFIAYQVWGPKTALPERAQAQAKEEKVVSASVTQKQTLHGQVNQLKEQIEQMVGALTGTAKTLKELQLDLDESKEARLADKKVHDRQVAEAKQREERLRAELERERTRQAKATTSQARATSPQESSASPVVTAPPVLFELRTIGSSQGRPKNAPTPLTHHVATAYLAAGCLAKVRMVTGTDATSQLASGGGASWGHPMLAVVREAFDCAHKLDEIGAEVVRQRTRVPLDGCLTFATGKADLASSRVQAEATLLSCVMPDGEAYEVPIKGFLVGADGKQGIFGKVQTHESAKVGKAFIAGMIEEAAAFFSAARKGVTISVSGQSTPYGGMETTLNKIASYWLAQASALQPTIPVPSKTEAYLVILQGVPLEGMHMVNWLKTGVM